MEEVWKDIKGYEGFYQVSSLGNVRSLNWGNTGEIRNLYLKPHNKGYLQVELSFAKKKKMYTVHRLVAETFIDNPNNYPCVNHKDENKKNNAISNLEWCTHKQNNEYSLKLHPERLELFCHSSRNRNKESKKGIANKRFKSIVQMDKNGETIRYWPNLISIKSEMKWNEWSIQECCEGKRNTAYGYKWHYAI